MMTMAPDASWRLVVIAPHPDDEVVGTGLALRRVTSVGGWAYVLFLTDGDNNRWPQRFVEGRWRLGDDAGARWGRRRRGEATAALSRLGEGNIGCEWGGYPDQGLTRLLLNDPRELVLRLLTALRRWSATHLLFPSPRDRHPDHSAAGLLTVLALDRHGPGPAPWTYMVHGRPHDRGSPTASMVSARPEDERNKLLALGEHRSQLLLSRVRMLNHARVPELFEPISHWEAAGYSAAIGCQWHSAEGWHIQLRPVPPWWSPPRLCIAGLNSRGEVECLVADLSSRGRFILRSTRGNEVVGEGVWRDETRGRGHLVLPAQFTGGFRPRAVKIERRVGDYEQDGWHPAK